MLCVGVGGGFECVCLHFPARQLYTSPVWRSGYSPTSSRRCHTRTGHGSHAQNCLNRSQTSTHLLWRQIGGLQKVEFSGRANSPQWDSQQWHGPICKLSVCSLTDLWINEILLKCSVTDTEVAPTAQSDHWMAVWSLITPHLALNILIFEKLFSSPAILVYLSWQFQLQSCIFP